VSLPPPALTTISAAVVASSVVAVPLTVMKPLATPNVIVSAPASLVTVTVLSLTTGGSTVALASLAANRTPTVASAAISASRLGRENIWEYLRIEFTTARTAIGVRLQGRTPMTPDPSQANAIAELAQAVISIRARAARTAAERVSMS
jgi:hypothetical protein